MARMLVRVAVVGLFCAGVAIGLVLWLTESGGGRRRTAPPALPVARKGQQAASPARPPAEPEGNRLRVIETGLEDGGFRSAYGFTVPLADPMSLQELRESIRGRGRRGISEARARYELLRLDSPPKREQLLRKIVLERSLAELYMYEGKFLEAALWLQHAQDTSAQAKLPREAYADLLAMQGIVALRRGEVENCLECMGPSSCIFPLDPAAVHRNQSGSRQAVRWLTQYLDVVPGDLRASWPLMVAYMTLGEYPDRVPARYRIPVGRNSGSEAEVGRFQNVAPLVGLSVRGPNMAGGSIFDDFTGDGLPDLFTTSLDADLGASLFVNRGDGTFEDQSSLAGLGDQIHALNVTRTDYDNDGDLDVLLLRGAWEFPMRMSLLRNRGDGSFEDVTAASGLSQPISSEAAAWGDYDDDGWLDLFLCGEYFPPAPSDKPTEPDLRNRCRLYHNRGDGTFENVAEQAGVLNDRCGKGCAWGDYDADGRLDLFVSNMGQPCRLYHNEGGGKFHDVAPELGLTGAPSSFACWFWDYDNDGRLDIYVNDYRSTTPECVASMLGVTVNPRSRPCLYHNLGPAGFRDEAERLGLGRAMAPMGANFADIDNDGFLDIYLGTGGMAYGGLLPNLMFRNVDGQRFDDVTGTSRTGHLQKGHGVSFADWDGDGDLDLFCELGGASPGDQSYNLLFQNPGHRRHWLKVKLVGKQTNRAAIGTSLRADVRDATGAVRSIHRTIGNNSSFGGNSLVESLGLRDAQAVEQLTITWPTSHTQQTFTHIPADQAIEITEGSVTFKQLDLPRIPAPHP